MTKRKPKAAVIHVEPKHPAPKYGELPQDARDAIAEALLILIARGRQVLASQGADPNGKAADDQNRRRDAR